MTETELKEEASSVDWTGCPCCGCDDCRGARALLAARIRIRELEAAIQGRTVSCICGGKGKP